MNFIQIPNHIHDIISKYSQEPVFEIDINCNNNDNPYQYNDNTNYIIIHFERKHDTKIRFNNGKTEYIEHYIIKYLVYSTPKYIGGAFYIENTQNIKMADGYFTYNDKKFYLNRYIQYDRCSVQDSIMLSLSKEASDKLADFLLKYMKCCICDKQINKTELNETTGFEENIYLHHDRYINREQECRIFAKGQICHLYCANKEGSNILNLLARAYQKAYVHNLFHNIINMGISDLNQHPESDYNILFNYIYYVYDNISSDANDYSNDKIVLIINILLKKGILFNYINNKGYNALSWLLVQYIPADENINDLKTHWIIRTLKLFIQYEIDIHNINGKGNNSLIVFIKNICGRRFRKILTNNLDIYIIRKLVKHGININHKNQKGKTALMYAKDKNNTDIINLLIELGVNK